MKKLFVGVFAIFSLLYYVIGQNSVSESVIQLINSARNQAGILSLQMSSELSNSAQRHSDDMANIGALNHVGSDGSQFWERMIDADYELTTGAENILVRNDANPESVFNQWWNSADHQTNMMNPDYVEVGVAYAQSSNGSYYFTMVLGTRAGVVALPIATPTAIVPTAIPFSATSTSNLPTFTSIAPTVELPTLIPSITPTWTLSPLITPVIMTPLPTPTQTAYPSVTPFFPTDIRFIVDSDSFTLLNVSGRTLDLTGLVFQSDRGEMEATAWDTEFLTQPLNRFSSEDCLQVWGLEKNVLQNKVPDCRVRHGWVAVGESQLFWKGGSVFFVLNDNEVIAQCVVADSICDISFESRFIPSSDSSIVPLSSDRDIRLIYNQDSFTLLNIAGEPIDLNGLIFQSSVGKLNIDAWDTEFLTRPLGLFPPSDCLMAWGNGRSEQGIPGDCETRHGWIIVGADEKIWTGTSRFDVLRYNRVLAGCIVAQGLCEVNLEGNLGANSPTVVPPNSFNSDGIVTTDTTIPSTSRIATSDLTFIYDFNSFALINTSGQSLDISSLVFESDNGVFSASRWNTEFLTHSLSNFPAGDCVQVWGVNEELQTKPPTCETRHAWIAVAPELQFWRDTTQLRIRRGIKQLGVCDLRAGQCEVDFP